MSKNIKQCCVPGCSDRSSRRHRFPKSQPELFNLWIKNVNNPKFHDLTIENIYKSYKVCERHFENNCIVPGTKRGLTYDAVPTRYLQGDSSEGPSSETTHKAESSSDNVNLLKPSILCSENIARPTHLLDDFGDGFSYQTEGLSENLSLPQLCIQGNENSDDQDSPSLSRCITPTRKRGSTNRQRILAEVGVTRQNYLTPKAKHMYRKVVTWGTKICNLNRKINNYQKRLANANKILMSPKMEHLTNYVNNATYNFILSQIRNQCLPPKCRRFTLEDKLLALSVMKASGRGYRLLSKIFSLPSKRTLTNLLSKVQFEAGIQPRIFEILQRSVQQMEEHEKICAVVFDEMSLGCSLQYNTKYDCIYGIEDFGTKRNASLADHVNVFMIKGIFRKWKQPVCFTFSKGPCKSIELRSLLKEIIIQCQNIGLTVVASICDQGQPNRAAINLLKKETKEYCIKNNIENRYQGYLVNGKEIVPIYDIPHLVKGIRNNLLTKPLHFKEGGEDKVAKWEHIQKFYFLDKEEETRICPKLTDRHILRNKMNKMKVSLCTQVFSHKVGSLMNRIAKWNVNSRNALPLEATHTASLILFIDKLFDSCNSHSKIGQKSKPLKSALTEKSDHEKFWKSSIETLTGMRFFSAKKQKLVTVPSLTNFVVTLKSFLYLKKTLLVNNSNRYICLRDLNQDALENFFGSIRSYGYRNINPSVNAFIAAFKSLLINNFMSSHSPSSNCEEDRSEGALDNLKSFLTEEMPLRESLVQEHQVEPDIPNHILARKTRIGRCTIKYMAGYFCKKIMKVTSCKLCKDNVLNRDSSENTDTDFIDAGQYEKSSLIKPGTYMYLVVSRSLSTLFYVIPRICHIKKISQCLSTIITNKINFNSFNCPEHKDFGMQIANVIVKCCLYFWCRKINRIASNKDSKFEAFLRITTDRRLIDPIKLMAYKKSQSNKKKIKQ